MHRGGISPRIVAEVITKIVVNDNPHNRYIIGNREKLVLLTRKTLPDGLFYGLIEKRRVFLISKARTTLAVVQL